MVIVVSVLTAAGCGDDGTDTGDTAGDQTTTAPGDTAPPDGSSLPSLDDLPSFDTLQDIVAALDEDGIACDLEYEGLEDDDKIVSLCTIEASQSTLTIWKDPAAVAELVGSGAATELTVYGQNWTIDLRDPAVAATVADALDGETG